jgi:hypothetical protein
LPSQTKVEDEETPARNSASPSEVTEEHEGSNVADDEYPVPRYFEPFDHDVIGDRVNWDARPVIHDTVHVQDDSDSESGVLAVEVTSMSPLPFDVADDGVGSLMNYLLQPDGVLSLPTDDADATRD